MRNSTFSAVFRRVHVNTTLSSLSTEDLHRFFRNFIGEFVPTCPPEILKNWGETVHERCFPLGIKYSHNRHGQAVPYEAHLQLSCAVSQRSKFGARLAMPRAELKLGCFRAASYRSQIRPSIFSRLPACPRGDGPKRQSLTLSDVRISIWSTSTGPCSKLIASRQTLCPTA